MNYAQLMTEEKDRDPEEELLLWREFRAAADPDVLRTRLVEFYLPLVVRIARKMPEAVRRRMALDELVSIGVIGLNAAIDGFAVNRKNTFATYAYMRIRGSILDELRRQDSLTRTQRNYYRDICAAIRRLTAQLLRPPTDEELSRDTGLTPAEIERYIGMGSESVNLSDEFRDGLNYFDVIPDDNAPSPEEVTHHVMALEKLRRHFHDLTEREQKILFLRHFEEMSVREVAAAMEISEGRISQIYQKIILKLRALMENA